MTKQRTFLNGLLDDLEYVVEACAPTANARQRIIDAVERRFELAFVCGYYWTEDNPNWSTLMRISRCGFGQRQIVRAFAKALMAETENEE